MELALAHHRVGKVQAVELYLPRTEVAEVVALALIRLQFVDELVVKRTVGNELKGADRVRYTLEIVALTVREVIHRVSVPLCSGAVVRRMYYTVHYRVAEVHVRVGHVELGAKHHRAFLCLGSIHLMEQLQTLLYRPVPVWRRRAGLRGRTLLLGYLLACLLVYVSLALLNHPLGKVPKLLEIV